MERFYAQDKGFRVCVASQGSSQAVSSENDLRTRFPHLNVQRLIGVDSGVKKRQVLEDFNKTLASVNVFIYSPTIESSADVTVPVRKVYGVLCC